MKPRSDIDLFVTVTASLDEARRRALSVDLLQVLRGHAAADSR